MLGIWAATWLAFTNESDRELAAKRRVRERRAWMRKDWRRKSAPGTGISVGEGCGTWTAKDEALRNGLAVQLRRGVARVVRLMRVRHHRAGLSDNTTDGVNGPDTVQGPHVRGLFMLLLRLQSGRRERHGTCRRRWTCSMPR